MIWRFFIFKIDFIQLFWLILFNCFFQSFFIFSFFTFLFLQKNLWPKKIKTMLLPILFWNLSTIAWQPCFSRYTIAWQSCFSRYYYWWTRFYSRFFSLNVCHDHAVFIDVRAKIFSSTYFNFINTPDKLFIAFLTILMRVYLN